MWRVLALAIGLFLALPAMARPVAVPPLTTHILDLTGTLTPDQSRMFEAKLAWVQLRIGAQTTGAESIDAYALRAFNTWKLGRRDINDGVLLLVAKSDRKVRIEVGFGLEQAIPDATAVAIVQDRMVPAFRAGDFAGGLAAAVSALIPLLRGAGLPAPRKGADAGRITIPVLREAA